MAFASVTVIVLTALSLAVSAGGLGVPAAARAIPELSEPGPGQPDQQVPGASAETSPSEMPVPSGGAASKPVASDGVVSVDSAAP